jgi:S-DNA-T family DNA segregation ATPase FtsK/SpoIIIE
VSSGTDSRTILDMTGAEKLLGKGDMLFSPVGLSKPRRIQGSFVSDKEIENIVNFIKQDGEVEYSEEMIEKITSSPGLDEFSEESDPLIEDAIAFVVEREKASTSMLQRKFRIGYNRAARMMEELQARGLVGPEDGAKPRKVLMTPYQHREYVSRRQEAIDAQIKSGEY